MSVLTSTPLKRYTLSYTLEGEQTGTDENGNPVFGSTAGELTALLAPYKFDQLQPQPGADPKVTSGRGELLEPLQFPEGLGVGSEFACEYAGRAGILKVTSITENDLPGVAFGAYFQFDLRFE